MLADQLVTKPNEILIQVPRALVASVLSALVDFGVLILLVELCGWSPLPAAVIGYLAGGVLQYVLCSYWVFNNAPSNLAIGFAAFTILSLVGLAITWLVMAAQQQFQVPYLFAKIAALGLAFTWNFLSRKLLLFRST